jgi:hypothetical protein
MNNVYIHICSFNDRHSQVNNIKINHICFRDYDIISGILFKNFAKIEMPIFFIECMKNGHNPPLGLPKIIRQVNM